ncbi:MAG: hypothetical protein MI725_07960, partial [Pirellulales bacterium]|nr:hypothetical protein [Pirellulales bacterium]
MIRILMIPTLAAASWLVGAPGALAQPQAEPMILEARIGLNGIFKLGCWTPLEVELLGGTKAYTGRVEATVPDSDGVPTTVFSPRPVGIEPGQSTTARLFLRVGQAQSTLRVRFRADGKVRSARTFYAGPVDNPDTVSGGTPATDLVMLVFGPALGLGELVQAPDGEEPTSRVTRIERAAELPTQWYGYEGIDVVLLTTSAPELYRPLLQNPLRREALHKWVVQGGRLVLFCGANGEELLSQGGPLAALLPGKYVETIKLRQSQPWELFCGAEAPITPDRRLNILAPRLEEVRGQILMNAGTKSADLPLVIRSQMGLGEVVFIGADFDRPPFKDWSARTSFLKKVLDWREDELQTSSEPGYGVEYVTDLTAQFRDALESKFIGVEVVPFGVVALLVGVYIVLIGPGDYFLVHKVFRRAELTWLAFPLIVVAISVVAYWLANWMKGDQMRVNQ